MTVKCNLKLVPSFYKAAGRFDNLENAFRLAESTEIDKSDRRSLAARTRLDKITVEHRSGDMEAIGREFPIQERLLELVGKHNDRIRGSLLI